VNIFVGYALYSNAIQYSMLIMCTWSAMRALSEAWAFARCGVVKGRYMNQFRKEFHSTLNLLHGWSLDCLWLWKLQA